MPIEGYCYTGEDAAKIEQVVFDALKAVLTDILEAAGQTVGDDGIAIVFDADTAQKRFREKGQVRPFVLVQHRPTEERGCKVLDAEGNPHQARRIVWLFVLQMSDGIKGGDVTPQKTATSDRALKDIVASGLENKYGYLRDTLAFEDAKVERGDTIQPNLLNPVSLKFATRVRLAEDHLLEV